MLKIHNNLTRNKEPFVPIEPGKVGMYVCGMTVYDYCHLGHARVLVVFDSIARYLRYSGYEVTYVRNITDIDDKIIARAAENGESFEALTGRFIEAMNEDAAALGVIPPDQEPRATRYIDQIIRMIEALFRNGYAYVAGNGDVCYDVSKFSDYGRLSGKKLDELKAGARVGVEAGKDDPLDFVLWKLAKPGEPSWDSPWGAGRPGWHIECSAMSTHCLGDHFDIHGGGLDLQFPHHENEIAQSCGATGKPFVNVWIHNGFVRVDDEKMSKSLGNFFTVREVLKQYRPEEVRYFILSSHYRSPLNYSTENLDEARAALARLYTSLRDTTPADTDIDEKYRQAFCEVMDDDFNTARAIAVLHDIAGQLNRCADKQSSEAAGLAATMKSLGEVLGLLQSDPVEYLQSHAGTGGDGLADDDIQALIDQRNQARADRDFAEADRIRDLLQEQGISLEDGPEGTIWRRQ